MEWKTRKGESKKEKKKAEDGKVTLGRSEGQGIFFVKVHVRLADCPRHTAEKSI